MKKIIKTILARLLIVAMVVSLAACGNNHTTDTNNTDAPQTNTPEYPTVEDMNALYDMYLELKNKLEKDHATPDVNPEEPISVSVDTQVYGGKSYATIFEASNLFDGGDFETATLLEGAIETRGTPSISDAEPCTGNQSLMLSGTTSQYIKISESLPAGEYFLAAMVRWETREAGTITIEGTLGNIYTAEVTDEFIPVCFEATLETGKNASFYVGITGGASGTAYIDDLVLIKKDEVFVGMPIPPSYAMLQMYTNYIDIKRGRMEDEDDGVIYRNTALEAFKAKALEKANDMGIDLNDRGLYPSHGAALSANEMVRLGLDACSYTDFCRIWGQKSYRYVTGNLREVELVSIVQNDAFEAEYTILGGKTGSGGSGDPSYLIIVAENKHGTRYVGAVCKVMNEAGIDHRWEAMKALFDIATAIEENPQYDVSNVTVPYATGAAICKLPIGNAALPAGCVDMVFAQNADEKANNIQSTTKVLTACVALEWGGDIDAIIEVKAEDIVSSGIVKSGDIVTMRDLLYAMMLPSCNNAAYAMARVVGEKIVSNYCDKFGL